MRKPPQIMTKDQLENQRRKNIARYGKEYKQNRNSFTANAKHRRQQSEFAKSQIETLSGIDGKYSSLIDLFNYKIAKAKENLEQAQQTASSLQDSELTENIDHAASQFESDISELTGQKASIASRIEALNKELDDLLVRYGSGTGNLGRNSSSESTIAAYGSASNTYDPRVSGAEDAAFERALRGNAAGMLGVSSSLMKDNVK